MDAAAAQSHAHHHEMPTSGAALTGVAISATLHCLTGCAIGEIAGMAIGTALGLLRDIARATKQERLEPGETFASGPFEIPGFEQRVWPGAEVELEAEGIGILANRLGTPVSNG